MKQFVFTAFVDKSATATAGSYIDEAYNQMRSHYAPIIGPKYYAYGLQYTFLYGEEDAFDDRMLVIEIVVAVVKREDYNDSVV